MANITYPDKIVGSQYLNTEANQVKEVVNTNAARLTTVEGVAPTANQKAALAGTHGSPSGSNRYVTDGDPRLGGLSLPKAIFLPVDDVDALRAIDTTDATQYPNNWLIFVKTLGVYYLDRAATGTDDGNLVIEPAGGVGRWIKETRTGAGGGGGPAIADVYADTTALLAAQGDQEAQAVYRVDDASGFGLTGYAYYEYLGTTVGDDTDYKLVGAAEYLVPGGGGSSTITVRNQTGSTIAKGTPVYLTGAASGFPLVALARADAASTCTNVFITDEEIPNNSEGEALKTGEVTPVSTTGFTAGDLLYLSATTAGVITSTPPASPNFVVFLGIAANSTASGKLVISIRTSLANSNTLGTSQLVPPSQNAVKEYVDANVPTVGFTVVTATNLTINPTKRLGNNYRWEIPAANPTLTWDFAGVPDGAEGILEIIKDNSATSRFIALPADSTINEDDYSEEPDIATSNINISAVANNGSGLIRLTATAHGLTTGMRALVNGVGGTVEANFKWTVTVIDANTIDLQGSTFVNTYTSGGTVRKLANYLAIEQAANALTIISFYNRNGRIRMNLRRGYFNV